MADEKNSGDAGFGLQTVLSKVTTKGDLATVLIAMPVGFTADVLLSLGGVISPGTCAFLLASAALGAKKTVEAGIEERTKHRDGRQLLQIESKVKREETTKIEERAKKTIELLKRHELTEQAGAIERELELHQVGVELTDQKLTEAIEMGISAYRQKLGRAGDHA